MTNNIECPTQEVLIKTKSNFRGLNNEWCKVHEMEGTRVTCLIWDEQFQKEVQVDFQLREVYGIRTANK